MRRCAPAADGSARAGCGGGEKNSASGTIVATTMTAKPSIAACQPNSVIPRSKTEGQTMPARYCPDEINATAVPRRRSNQRLT